MAAALLMMNMHGVVCASDCDRTIFRYSDKIPFAIMVDPTSELRWEDIIMNYREKSSITSEKLFKDCAKDFRLYLMNLLKQKDLNTQKKESNKTFVCVGYDLGDIFPRAAVLKTVMTENELKVNMAVEEISQIQSVYLQCLGNCENIRILLGGMSDDIVQKTIDLFLKKLGKIVGNKDAERLIQDNKNYILEEFEKMQKDPKVMDAISFFTIKDMVSMAENLIETEGLLGSSDSAISPTREIGIVTLAEGFVYIKHSLYGA